MSYYLPKCCSIHRECNGSFVIVHYEMSAKCLHQKSGGTGGYEDGITPCNRAIGHGKTIREAIEDARGYLNV